MSAREPSGLLLGATIDAMTGPPHHLSRDTGVHGSQNKERKGDKRKLKPAPSIDQALSKIAHEMPAISIIDVTTFATRSVEVRQKEKAKNGKVKRPLNAFMLYRKAYQDVAKTQCTRNNHQQVSTICGSSWNNWEPPSIITQFRDLAKIEKEMHEAAFPEYKYDPVQAKKPGDGISRNSKTCGLGEGESNCRRRRSGRQQVGLLLLLLLIHLYVAFKEK